MSLGYEPKALTFPGTQPLRDHSGQWSTRPNRTAERGGYLETRSKFPSPWNQGNMCCPSGGTAKTLHRYGAPVPTLRLSKRSQAENIPWLMTHFKIAGLSWMGINSSFCCTAAVWVCMRASRLLKTQQKQEGNALYRPMAYVTLVSQVKPIYSYYMVIFPKLTSGTPGRIYR